MARRKTLNRKRNSIRRSIDSVGSGLLDPDTNIVDEEQTFWWNHLQENAFSPHSLRHNINETTRHLSANSQIDSSQSPSEWWKNLEHSGSEHAASTSARHNLSAAIVKTNILQTSTSESERELDLKKRKIRLKATNNRKSINNAFSSVLNETTVPLKLRKKRASYSDFHSDLNKKVSQERLQKDEEGSDLNTTENILKSKPSISRRRRDKSTEDQNPFQDILTKDSVLDGSDIKKLIALEKETSRHLMHRSDASEDHTDDNLQKKSMRASQVMPLGNIETESLNLLAPSTKNAMVENNANEIVQSNDDSDIKIGHNKHLKLKSRFMQRARKSVGRNAFADALIDDSSISFSELNKKNDIHGSSDHVPMQAKDNIEVNLSSSSLDDNESRGKRSVFLKPKSRILKSLRNSLTKNPYEEIFEKEDNISARKSNVSTEDNRASFERNETTSIYDIEQDLSILKRVSKLGSDKEADLTRNSLRNEPKTSKYTNIEVHEAIDNSDSDTNDREHDSSMSKRLSKLSTGKEARSTRINLRNRSETPTSANIVHEVIGNLHNDANKEHDSSMLKRLSKSSPVKEAHLTRKSSRNQSETTKSVSKDMELPKQPVNWINIENDNDANSELNVDSISQVSSTRIPKVSVNIGTRKSTILSADVETTDDEDADPEMQTIQRNSTLTKTEEGNKAVSRQSVPSSNRTSIKEVRETGRQKSLSKSQNYHNTPVKTSSKDISFNTNKLNSSKTLRKIDDFFKVKQASTMMDKQLNERAQKSQIFDTEKMNKIKTELERIKNREMAAMKIVATDKKESVLKEKDVKSVTLKQATKKKPLANPTKVVDKAFLVDGKVYRAPRLPRPKHWATDRLYKFLWKHMESKYKLATRLKSEKFVQELAKIISLIERRKNYENYKAEMEALMKEMARLGIISTRNDFYHFCQDFLPYEFRVKVVPMLLPGNKNNIPFEPEKLHIPLLDT